MVESLLREIMELPSIFRPKVTQPKSKKPELSTREPVLDTQSQHIPTLEKSGILDNWLRGDYLDPKK
jgi:hypothetical protein